MSAWSKFPTASSRERGSALLAALCFAAVLALVLGSYLAVCDTAMQLSNRTLEGERSAQLAEAGFEQALWALNNNNWSGWTTNSSGTATKTITGFSYEDGSTGSIILTITNYAASPGTSRTLTTQGVVTLSNVSVPSRPCTTTLMRPSRSTTTKLLSSPSWNNAAPRGYRRRCPRSESAARSSSESP